VTSQLLKFCASRQFDKILFKSFTHFYWVKAQILKVCSLLDSLTIKSFLQRFLKPFWLTTSVEFVGFYFFRLLVGQLFGLLKQTQKATARRWWKIKLCMFCEPNCEPLVLTRAKRKAGILRKFCSSVILL
jgi:hypothetical protein